MDGQIRFEYGHVWTWKFLPNPQRKICGFKKYLDTSERGLKVPSHCHFDKVWERHSCDNMARKFAKKCAARSGFFFVYQSNLLHPFFIFTLPSPSSWLLELPSSVTMQNNFWYATISLKSRRFDGTSRRKRRPQLLANREVRMRKQLNLLSWMLATILTKYWGSFAFKNPPREVDLCV